MSQWTSKRAILRDLRRAQGSARGGAGSGRAGPEPRPLLPAERPPPLCLQEETEEEFFKNFVGDGNVGDKPDLGLIQQMLDMVRDLNVTEEEVRCTDTAVISKLNPTCLEFTPCHPKPRANGSAPHEIPPPEHTDSIPPTETTIRAPKKLRQRNIALESILQAIENREQNGDSNAKPLALLKPVDLMPTVNVDTKLKSEAVEKVNGWMTQMLSPIKMKRTTVVLDSTTMFKKKSKPEISKPCVDIEPSAMFKRKHLNKSDVVDKSGSGGAARGAGGAVRPYVPSERAAHFYQQFVAKSQLMDALHDDIWTKAEKQMKSIDEKKRILAAQQRVEDMAAVKVLAEAVAGAESEAVATAEAVSSASSLTDLSQCGTTNVGWRHVKLPQHRHLLTAGGACAVCAVCAVRARPRPRPPRLQPADTAAAPEETAAARRALQRVPTLADLTAPTLADVTAPTLADVTAPTLADLTAPAPARPLH